MRRFLAGSTSARLSFFCSLLVLASLSVPAWARFEPVTCGNNPFTPEQEISEGNKVAAQVYQQMPVIPDNDPVSRYIQSLGARLVQHAPVLPGVNRQWPFNFHVVASEDINAFALPGGSVFVNLGTIQAAETEAQLAGVMAHEISHDVMRHSTCNIAKQRNKGLLYGLGQIGAGILLGNGAAGQIAQAGLGLGENLDFLRMSRADEEQADLLGVNILRNAGYDPRGLPQFFEVIAAKYGAGGAQFLSDHPNPGNRTEYVDKEIATLAPLANPIVRTAAFTQAHAEAAQRRALSAADVKSGAWKNSGQYASGPGAYGRVQQGNYPQQQGNRYPQQQGNGYPQQQQGNYPQQQGNGYPQQQQGNYPQQQGNYPQQQQGNYPQQQGNGYPQQQGNYPQQQQGNYPQQQGQPSSADSSPTIAPIPTVRLGLRSRLVQYRGPRWSIRYPSTWRATSDPNSDPNSQNGGRQSGQNQPAPTINITPVGGSGSFGVAYGVVVGVEPAQGGNGITDNASLSAAASGLIQRFLGGDSGMTQTSAVRSVQVGGHPALVADLAGVSPVALQSNTRSSNGSNHQRERDLLVMIARPDGDMSYLVFVAPEQDFNRLKPVFDSMLTSFNPQ